MKKIVADKVDKVLGLDHVTRVSGLRLTNVEMPPGVRECGGFYIFHKYGQRRHTVRVKSVLP